MASSQASAEKETRHSLGHRAPLLWLLIPFVTGLSLAHANVTLPGIYAVIFAFIFGVLGFIFLCLKYSNSLALLAFCIPITLLGLIYYEAKRSTLSDWDWLPPREAELSLRITRLFARQRAESVSGLAVVEATAPHLGELLGQRVYFSLRNNPNDTTPPLLRSSIVKAIGVISALPNLTSPESFDSYLSNSGVSFRLTQGRIVESLRPASSYRQFCGRMADRFNHTLSLGVADKQPERASVFRAMLLGQQSELNEEQNWLFRSSGTMHVFAISGLHIGVIAAALHAVLVLLRIPPKMRLVFELSLLWLYVDITGAAPSAVRAFIMIAFVLFGFAFRLPINPLATLTHSALLVICLNPFQLFSASFQMSYGIVASLVLIGLPLAEQWQQTWQPYRMLPRIAWRWYQHALDFLRYWGTGALAISTAATLVSSLTSVQFFRLFTPGALFINLLVIPAASFVIISGFVSLLCGLIGFTVGCVVANHAAVLWLMGIECVISLLMKLPHLWFNASFREPWMGSLSLVALMISLLTGYSLFWRGWARFYVLPFVVVALSFLLAVHFE